MEELMQGVTILSQNNYRECSLIGAIIVTILIIGFLSLFIYMCALGAWHDCALLMLILNVILIIFIWADYEIWTDYNTIYTEYKVTIDDSVPLKEFSEKYNITNQDGQIYTIEEKS